jgi:hypothetical protein
MSKKMQEGKYKAKTKQNKIKLNTLIKPRKAGKNFVRRKEHLRGWGTEKEEAYRERKNRKKGGKTHTITKLP